MSLLELPTIDAVQAAALPETGPCRDTVAFTLFLSLIAPSEGESQAAAALADQFVHLTELSDADLTRAKYDALALRDKFATGGE